MRTQFIAGCLAALSVLGPASVPVAPAVAAPQQQSFNDWIVALSKAAAADSRYRRIPLDTDAQTQGFLALAEKLYNRQISADEFRKTLGAQYPGHDYEISFIISRLP